jgi:hypothetical protein
MEPSAVDVVRIAKQVGGRWFLHNGLEDEAGQKACISQESGAFYHQLEQIP